jgi:hypothetical protein
LRAFLSLARKDKPHAFLLGWTEKMASVPLVDEVIAAHVTIFFLLKIFS